MNSDEDRIKECILNIDMICRSVFLSYEEMSAMKFSQESVVFGEILKYRYIQLCSILDELDILSGLSKSNAFLKDTLTIISPLRKAITKFDGIYRARNTFFAHYNRDKKRQFYPFWKSLKGLKLPSTPKQMLNIYRNLQMINIIICTRHYSDLMEISERYRNDLQKFEQEMKGQSAGEDAEEFEKTANAVLLKMEELGMDNQFITDPIWKNALARLNRAQENIELQKRTYNS